MFQRVTKLFKSADFIGSKVEPTFNSQSQVQSYFGACVSIILLIIGGLGFGFFGKEVITKGTVRSTQSVITLEEASLRLTETPFMMMFRSSDTILNFNQPFRRAVKISARLTQIRTGGEAQIKAVFHEIPIVNCSNVRFHEAAEQRIVHFKLDKRAFLCFDFAALKLPEEEKVIRNSYSAANSNTLVLNIKKCDEKADPGCRTYLDKVMPNFTFTSSIPTYTLDISKYDSPIEFSSKTISSSLTKDFFTGQLLSMDYNKLETDEGWFIDSIKQDEFFTKGNVEYSFGP